MDVGAARSFLLFGKYEFFHQYLSIYAICFSLVVSLQVIVVAKRFDQPLGDVNQCLCKFVQPWVKVTQPRVEAIQPWGKRKKRSEQETLHMKIVDEQ